jgi:hypothetical protein
MVVLFTMKLQERRRGHHEPTPFFARRRAKGGGSADLLALRNKNALLFLYRNVR